MAKTPKAPKASQEERAKRVYKGVKRGLSDGTAGNLGSRPVEQYIKIRDKKIQDAADQIIGALRQQRKKK